MVVNNIQYGIDIVSAVIGTVKNLHEVVVNLKQEVQLLTCFTFFFFFLLVQFI